MVYKAEVPKMGLIIDISTHRKCGNGAVGGGRKNASGKKAVVSKDGNDDVVVTGSTTKDLLKQVRRQFNIPPNIKINEKGQTYI